MCKSVIIIGAGGYSRVVADIISKSGDKVFGYLDDDLSKAGVIGSISDCEKYENCFFVFAIGDNKVRRQIAERYTNLRYYTAIHPTAVISEDVCIGEGTVVMPHAVINASADIGKHCIINTSSIIEHDNKISDYVHISPAAVLCGTVSVGQTTHIGAAAVVINNIDICQDCMIGAGALVVRNITEPGIYKGVPVM